MHNACSPQSVDGLVFDQVLLVVIGQGKSGGSVASECGSESEENDVLGLPVILGSDELSKIFLGNVGLALMVNVEKKLATGEQLVDS